MAEQKKTIRNSRQRNAVLKVLRSTTSHPTADWIYGQVRKSIPNVSLGTIYRNLKLLKEMGEIIELNYGSTFSRFDGNPVPHYHLICERCGRVFDVHDVEFPGMDEEVARKTDFQVKGHRLEFYGVCPDCDKDDIKN